MGDSQPNGVDRQACHHDRDRAGRLMRRQHERRCSQDDEDVHFEVHHFMRQNEVTVSVTFSGSPLDRDVLPVMPPWPPGKFPWWSSPGSAPARPAVETAEKRTATLGLFRSGCASAGIVAARAPAGEVSRKRRRFMPGWWGDSMRDVKYGRCPALRREVGHWKQAVRRQSATKDRRDSDLVILCVTAKSAARRSAE